MIEKIMLDMLTQDSVSVKTQRYVVVDEQEYPIGEPHRKAYVNSVRGRQAVQNEIPEPHRSAIFALWGENPTVGDRVQE
mgnify:CR=1 FL=1